METDDFFAGDYKCIGQVFNDDPLRFLEHSGFLYALQARKFLKQLLAQ
jgi:hypothetical protein